MRYQYRSSTPVWALVAANIFVFIITAIRPGIMDYLALTKPIFGSNYWAIVTAMFAHANIFHILFNMLILYV